MIAFARILVLSLWAFSAVDRYLGRDESSITNGKNLIDLDWTQQATSEDIQNNLASVGDRSLKEGAFSFNLSERQDQEGDQKEGSDPYVRGDRDANESNRHLRSESLSNARTKSGAKIQDVNIGKGVSGQKEIEVKSETIVNRAGSTAVNMVVFALYLTIVCVSVGLMPKASIQLLLLLQMFCLLCHFMVRRCGELFVRYQDYQNDIEQGDRGDSSHLLLMFFDTVDLVNQDRTCWYRNHGKALNAAIEEHLWRVCSPQRHPPPAALAAIVVAEEPADGAEAVEVDAAFATAAVEESAVEEEAVGVDAASDPSAAPATTAAVVAGAPPVQELPPTSIDDVCSRIKKGLGPEYAQLPPFSPTYFRVQRVVEFNMRSLITATRGLDWTKKIDPLDVDMVTVVTVVQSNEDIDAVFKNGVSPVRLEVPSGTGGGEGNLCPSKLLQSWLNSLIDLLKAATPTLTSAKSNDRASKTKGSVSKNGGARRSTKKSAATENKSDECALTENNDGASKTKTSGGASDNRDAGSPTEKSAATENRSDEWFVASVSELLKLDATKVSFDALHRLLEFALWPWRQKMAFLLEVADIIAVDSKSDGHAFLMALDQDLVERGKRCVFQWRVELVVVKKDKKWTEEWKEKTFQWTQPSERTGDLKSIRELGPYKKQVGLLNTLWAEHKGGFPFKSLSLRVLRAIRNMHVHRRDYSVYVSKQEMWRLVDTLFPSLFPFVAGAVMHKLSELHHRNESLMGGERWFLEHGTDAWEDAQISPSNDVKPFLNAVHQLGEARKAMCAVSPAEKVEVVK